MLHSHGSPPDLSIAQYIEAVELRGEDYRRLIDEIVENNREAWRPLGLC
jgi:hypothetical protein